MSGRWQWLFFIPIFLLAVGVRLLAYSHFDYSLGTIDTPTYLQASEIKFPSVAFFTSPRSATIPLLYKL